MKKVSKLKPQSIEQGIWSQNDNNKINRYLLDEAEMETISQIESILKPFYDHTIKLQSKQCTLSDFFGFLMKIVLTLSKIDEMDNWKEKLLNNPSVLGSVYLDPRFQRALNNEQKQTAILFLKTV